MVAAAWLSDVPRPQGAACPLSPLLRFYFGSNITMPLPYAVRAATVLAKVKFVCEALRIMTSRLVVGP